MARLSVYLSLLITLLSLVPFSLQGDPTYSECKPHIDATILDLAAKAVHAGVQSDDAKSPPVEEARQESAPPTASPPSPSYPPPPEPAYQSPPAPEPVQYIPPPPPQTVHYAPSSPQPAQQVPAPQAQQLGLFDKFISKFFGIEIGQRDPKYAQPWNTFPEFRKKAVKDEDETKKVDTTPGFITSTFNKIIKRIFTLSEEGTRDPKWAEPWQTHKEHLKKKKEDVPEIPVYTPGIFSRSVNKFVEIVFGKATTGERDPKWSTPWNTHEEHKRAPKAIIDKSQVAVQHNKGGLINSFVTLFFEVPKGEREPKWAAPWQSHPEHKKSAKVTAETNAVSTESGFIGKALNKFVLLFFKEDNVQRDPKWATNWRTHEEHVKKFVEDKSKPKAVEPSDFLGLRKLTNKFVDIIFGKSTGERDPKWAEPWQTHVRPGKTAHPVSTPPAPVQTPPSVASPAPPPPPSPLRAEPAPPPLPKVAPAPPSPPKEAPAPPPPPKEAPAPPPPPKEAPPPPPLQKAAPSPPPPPPPKVAEPAPPPPPPPVVTPAPPPPSPPKEEIAPPAPKEKEKESFPTDSKAGSKERAPSTPDRVASAPKAPVKQVLEEVAPEPKKEKIIEDEEQIVVVPSAFRQRDHIDSILGLDDAAKLSSARTDPIADSTLRDLKKLYETAVKPLEGTYKYQDISNRHLSDAELFGTPLVLMLGPYSTGKSTFINYLLGTEFSKRALKTGTPPSHGVFRIVKYGEVDRELDGTDLSGHWTFGFLQKFGQNFVDQLRGKELNAPLLRKVTFVEAPGILEMRRPGERLYPFNDVVQWFIDRADLILVMFDYTKLDAGYEMEAVLDQLKGREQQTRILLNKADQVPPEELIKVQGSLFWNLSPLLGVSAPPTVYAGSFVSLPYRPTSPKKLFQAQEEALLHDIAKAISSRVDNRIAIARRHAVRVRNHAQMVDTYLTTFYRNKGFLTSKHKLAEEIIENPHAYNIYEGVSLLTNISRYDLPDAEVYRDFFRIHNLYSFRTLKETCTFLAGCPIDKLDAAINKQLPELMHKYRKLVEAAAPGAKLPDANIRPGGVGANVAHAHHSKS